MDVYSRTRSLLGEERFDQLRRLRVMVVGVGGVGSHAAQALAHMGVGHLHLVDHDVIDITNANRHVQAQKRRITQPKVLALKSHLEETFDELSISTTRAYFSEETRYLLDEPVDIILECIDHLQAKILLIQEAQRRDIPILSAMGMGNRVDPSKLFFTTLYESRGCPLARRLRKEARLLQLNDIPVVMSSEIAAKTVVKSEALRHAPASCYLVPAACGNMMAYYVLDRFTTASRDTSTPTR